MQNEDVTEKATMETKKNLGNLVKTVENLADDDKGSNNQSNSIIVVRYNQDALWFTRN